MWVLRTILIVSMVLLPTGSFQADTFQVTKSADTDDGICDADCSLREAIDAANTNPGADDVPIPAGNYLLTLGQLVVLGDVHIAGAGQESTIIDGNASDRVFYIQPSIAAEISGVTIQNGRIAEDGGGIWSKGYLTLINSTVSGNTSLWGGCHADCYYNGGGGIYNGDELTLTNSTVSGNTADFYGGGIYNGRRAWVYNSTVSGNTAYYGNGGGIWNEAGGGFGRPNVMFLSNSTVSGNLAAERGGGIYNEENASPRFENLTVSGNTAYVAGGGIYGFFYSDDSIVADNSAPLGVNCQGGSLEYSSYYNLADDDSCGFTTELGNLVVADAMLGPLQDNGGPTETHALLPGSPAIDAGSYWCPPTDQRGVARPQGAGCDIGAVEYVPEPSRWLLLTAGLGCLGALRRVSRRV